jgi:hypothetical protein
VTKKILESFVDHLENGRIEKTDLTTYKSFDTIKVEVGKAEIKKQEKELAKETKILFSDDTWLILKPLSFRSSLCYGNQTKWCTASKNNPHYFYKYSTNGILVYIINKVDGRKFGVYSSSNEFSVWDVKDRRVDSMEMRLPADLVDSVRDWCDLKNPKNIQLFTEEALKEKAELMGSSLKLNTTITLDNGFIPVNPEENQDFDVEDMGVDEAYDDMETMEEEGHNLGMEVISETEIESFRGRILEAISDTIPISRMETTEPETQEEEVIEARPADTAYFGGNDIEMVEPVGVNLTPQTEVNQDNIMLGDVG